MKKFVVISLMMLSALTVSAQHHNHRSGHHSGHHATYERRDDRHHDNHRHDDRRYDDRHHGGPQYSAPKGRSGYGQMRHEIRCVQDWQELWNGCHVRTRVGRISVYNRRGDRLIWGDEVILLPSGCYKVRNGSFWHVHSPGGDRISNLWGDIVELLPGGGFRCYRAGQFFYYDAWGN